MKKSKECGKECEKNSRSGKNTGIRGQPMSSVDVIEGILSIQNNRCQSYETEKKVILFVRLNMGDGFMVAFGLGLIY